VLGEVSAFLWVVHWCSPKPCSPSAWVQTLVLNPAGEGYLPFHEARLLARELQLTSRSPWRQWWRESRPDNLPADCAQAYALEEWLSWGDFLG
jgi:hypothetical protein